MPSGANAIIHFRPELCIAYMNSCELAAPIAIIAVKASDNVIRILPPLNIQKEEIEEGINIINKTLKE